MPRLGRVVVEGVIVESVNECVCVCVLYAYVMPGFAWQAWSEWRRGDEGTCVFSRSRGPSHGPAADRARVGALARARRQKREKETAVGVV